MSLWQNLIVKPRLAGEDTGAGEFQRLAQHVSRQWLSPHLNSGTLTSSASSTAYDPSMDYTGPFPPVLHYRVTSGEKAEIHAAFHPTRRLTASSWLILIRKTNLTVANWGSEYHEAEALEPMRGSHMLSALVGSGHRPIHLHLLSGALQITGGRDMLLR